MQKIKTPVDYLTDYTPASQEVRLQMDTVRTFYTGLARQLDLLLPDGPEKTAGMRKLLEAKDCHVRALL